MSYLFIAVEILVGLLLIGIILLQRPKGGQGMGLAFGAGMGEQLFGAQAGNVLTRATVVLTVVFLINTTLLAMTNSRRTSGSVTEGRALPAASQLPERGGQPVGAPAAQPAAAPAAAELPAAGIPAQPAPVAQPAAAPAQSPAQPAQGQPSN